jgi:uroporphyrinogen III methyltransferase/synthase
VVVVALHDLDVGSLADAGQEPGRPADEVHPFPQVRALLPRADIAREALPDELRRAGATVDDVATYRTVREQLGREEEADIYKMLLEGAIDIVTFTSASSVRHFVTTLGEEQAADLLSRVQVASIGPVTAEAAQQLGIATTIMPTQSYTIPALVDAIVAAVAGRRTASA